MPESQLDLDVFLCVFLCLKVSSVSVASKITKNLSELTTSQKQRYLTYYQTDEGFDGKLYFSEKKVENTKGFKEL